MYYKTSRIGHGAHGAYDLCTLNLILNNKCACSVLLLKNDPLLRT